MSAPGSDFEHSPCGSVKLKQGVLLFANSIGCTEGETRDGLFSWNATYHGLLKELGGSHPANIEEFQASFASPVKRADMLLTET